MHVIAALLMAAATRATDLNRTKIAVCVAGMPERLQPGPLLENLVLANGDFEFDVVYALAAPSALFYSTDGAMSFASSAYAELPPAELRAALERLVGAHGARIRVHVIEPFIADLAERALRAELGVPAGARLDRIVQAAGGGVYGDIQTRILNMYRHEAACALRVEALERARAARFDAVVSAREDVYFWRDVDLSSLLPSLDAGCDIIAKDCLFHGGINMRLQLLRRSSALRVLRERLPFYASLFGASRSVFNAEAFELEQAHALNLNVCKRSVEALPVAVARLTDRDGAFCFPPWEVEHARERRRCVPSGFENFTRSRRCAPPSG